MVSYEAKQKRSPYEILLAAEKKRKLQASLAAFFREAWAVVDPAPLSWSWHHDAICEHIQAVYKGEIHKLAVALPPRHTKSSIISVTAPAWGWTWKPSLKVLCASYGMSLAIRDSQRCRALVDSPWYQGIFGSDFGWLPEQNQKQRYENDHHGVRVTTSVAGGTGEGADLLAIDDAHNIDEAESDAIRRATLNWFDNTMTSRLNDQQTGGMIIIGQRVHSKDLIGHVLEQGGWEYLSLPAEYEPSRKTFTSIGWCDPRTEEGQPLWEEKFPKAILAGLKKILASQYYAQYQQAPVTEEGSTIKTSMMLEYVDEGETYLLYAPHANKRVLKMLCRRVVSTDFAVSLAQQADFTVFLSWDITPDGEALLIDITIEKWEGPEAEAQLELLLRKSPRLWCVLIEDVAYQKSIIQRFRKGGFPVRPFNPRQLGDKMARLQSIAVYFNLALFFFNRYIPTFQRYRTELIGFPNAEHDDAVDATSILYELYSKGEPMMTAIDMDRVTVLERLAALRAGGEAELADFLLEGVFDD